MLAGSADAHSRNKDDSELDSTGVTKKVFKRGQPRTA